jgi:hypothetical protein
MNAASMKLGLVRLGGLCALTGLTVLLTLLFSFLGNLSCAVVAGMILGSGRRWQWDAIPVSLIFPAVILILSHFSKVDVPASKLHLVALVSSGAFWGVMGLTFSLRFLERKPDAPSTPAGASRGREIEAPPASLSLATLSGNWTCETSSAPGAGQSKILSIEEGKFVLTERRLRGRDRVLARGEVMVNPAGAGEIVFIPKASPEREP